MTYPESAEGTAPAIHSPFLVIQSLAVSRAVGGTARRSADRNAKAGEGGGGTVVGAMPSPSLRPACAVTLSAWVPSSSSSSSSPSLSLKL